jgi:hypothetical protein
MAPMNPPVRRIAPFLVVTLFAISSVFAAGERNKYNPLRYSTGKFNGCPPNGEGGDPYLNSLKNRDKPPFATTKYASVAKLTQTLPRLPDKKIHRNRWSPEAQDAAAIWERRAVTVEGFLVCEAAKQNKEACNCGSKTDRDFHLWMADAPSLTKASRAKAMVVEVSPRMLPRHPNWPKDLRAAIKAGTKVRVTGWVMWDQEHKGHLGGDAQHPLGNSSDTSGAGEIGKTLGQSVSM